MDSRREFIKKAAMIAGATGVAGVLPASIQKALAIDPPAGSTWLDAEHVVILMQENRSFDHCYGALRGVRGYHDPRAIELPGGNPVWLQTNAAGETYAPFRLDIKDTNATWMGSLPHSWTNQVDARNEGRHDKWLQAKSSGNKEYEHMPLTLGYYDRRDIPFYYSLADAFTVCDQNFCSSLTGTTPNRLYLWTGTIRDQQNAATRARVRNQDTDYGVEANWTTFPERLEDHGIDWRVYQNEISLHPAFKGEEEDWLANFTDNPLEWFTQYNVRFSRAYMPFIPVLIQKVTKEVDELQQKVDAAPSDAPLKKQLEEKRTVLETLKKEQKHITPDNYNKLTPRQQSLHTRAFTRNSEDVYFHNLTTLHYQDGDSGREMQVPKGDVLHQFRQDVRDGKLPTVSWLVAPSNFSDHPGSPWYGAWYVSEVMDILTHNPEVWKKTIFILCYDENDGYFDHVPPFTAPDPSRQDTGKVSKNIDAGVEWVTREQDLQRCTEDEARSGPVGLGYRVPLVIASPWSRGGFVNSQVFDHTSILQFMEKFLSHKSGKKIVESNISAWRRTVCGDLTSVFRPYNGERIPAPKPLVKNELIEGIHKAKFRQLPAGYKQLTNEDVEQFRRDRSASPLMPGQEKGTRPSCALPYELYAEADLNEERNAITLNLHADKLVFGDLSAGSPFAAYIHGKEWTVRNYAVAAGDQLTDDLSLGLFADGKYDLRVHGPNGFYRAFAGSKDDPPVVFNLDYEFNQDQKLSGRLILRVMNTDGGRGYKVQVKDNAYGAKLRTRDLGAGGTESGSPSIMVDTRTQSGWYDLSILIEGFEGYERRYAGRIETGKDSISDPAMG
jgi:phospholipase C